MVFQNRVAAGRQLASRLRSYKDKKDVIVLGVPRGGVVVAAEVARTLKAPLDVVVVRKLGAPGNRELALGAVDSDGRVFLHTELVRGLGVSREYLEKVERAEREEARRREETFRTGRPPLSLTKRVVIVVDDGIATGATTAVALRLVRLQKPQKVVLAAPVAPPQVVEMLRPEAEELVILFTPADFAAVGQFYQEFAQVGDEEVRLLLKRARWTERRGCFRDLGGLR